eukprot:CAMPEP_0174893294 /NCGR_PEP_ID=MMETSP0167-20121228/8127_1 /TAXON_ID=38298 /ORGANISM="Rhodella maculata, Strain CCMP736" /LENGTH=120 /DNA_ID=CAMNT_0016132043 /DNA_START=63 /DNA_END=425 /DNA_ORIENTATION=+
MSNTAFVCSPRAAALPSSSRSTFLCGTPSRTFAVAAPARVPVAPKWTMGKVAAFGPFSPVVIAARVVIGEKNFNQLRGKGIALHSQVITNFVNYVGAGPQMRQQLIRLAKNNGNTLGFLS